MLTFKVYFAEYLLQKIKAEFIWVCIIRFVLKLNSKTIILVNLYL